jgi:hypothetical protein
MKPNVFVLIQFTLLLTALPVTRLSAQETAQELPTVVVTGKAEDLLGEAVAASAGQASSEEILERPILRRGEILETIPGLIVTQHAGGGKANQYFLRGFNLDHGTDFSTWIEGMPLNMRTHAHGQGYTDLNPLLPELVQRLEFVKGNYTTANGDLSTAGSATFVMFDVLPRNLATFEIGENNYYRGLLAGTILFDAKPQPLITNEGKNAGTIQPGKEGAQHGLTYGFEYNYYDGPWAVPEHFTRGNVFLRYFNNDADDHFSVTFMGYKGKWNSDDQIPQRAINRGMVDRFGTIDDTTGGDSQRYSLNAVWEHRDGNVVTRANVFGIYYDLDLYSNFTYFLENPLHGDQFNQAEKRWVFGGNLSRTWEHQTLFGKDTQNTLGFQTRQDIIDPIGLYKTQSRQRLSTVREDRVYEGSYSLYAENTTRWSDWFRTDVGVRGDLFDFDTQSNLAANSGSQWAGIVSPKINLIFGPWHDTEFYLSYGMGFHSNDARGVNNTVDPTSLDRLVSVTPLVRTQGAEFGVRTQAVKNLTSTLTLFWLRSDSELVYVGDAGVNEPGPASQRLGVEWSNYWRPARWFGLDAELAATHVRFIDSPGADRIPDSVPLMFSGGLTVGAQGDDEGFFGTLRARAFAQRPLIEDNSVQGKSSFLVNAAVGYRRRNWEAVLDCLNLFNRDDNDIEYYYTSRLPGEAAAGVDDIHLHPTEPRTFRLRVTYRF